VADAALTLWRFTVSGTNGRPFLEDFSMFFIVAAITGYLGAVDARIKPTFEKNAYRAAHPWI
jgi:hypothetical protein